jgi:hypothetical protein
MRKQRTRGLVGLYGHSLDERGDVRMQFEIVRTLIRGTYACQLFSWMSGQPTEIITIHERDLTNPGMYRLYPDFEAMDHAAEMDAKKVERREREAGDTSEWSLSAGGATA